MRTFKLERQYDTTPERPSVVAQGVEFDDGQVAVRFVTRYRSTAIYSSLVEFEAVHAKDDNSKVVFV